MTHASLFSGIGGFDYAAELAGWTNSFNCEIDPFCQTVLKYHFPDAKQYTDIRGTDFSVWRGRIDVLTGGFPCQPFSAAGKRKGTDDERHLWPEMLRAIRQIRPRWVVGENVFGITNWNAGLVFEQVCADLEAAGYKVQPYILPACGVDAPHQRYRVWFVAYRSDAGTKDLRRERENAVHGFEAVANAHSNDAGRCGYGETGCEAGTHESKQEERERIWSFVERISGKGVASDAESEQGEQLKSEQSNARSKGQGKLRRSCCPNGNIEWESYWQNFPTQSPVCSRNDGFSLRLDGITFSKWRQESIKAYGNAIVSQVVLQIFKAINEYERLTP